MSRIHQVTCGTIYVCPEILHIKSSHTIILRPYPTLGLDGEPWPYINHMCTDEVKDTTQGTFHGYILTQSKYPHVSTLRIIHFWIMVTGKLRAYIKSPTYVQAGFMHCRCTLTRGVVAMCYWVSHTHCCYTLTALTGWVEVCAVCS